MNNKKLYKSVTDKKIAGVCGGIAEYFGIDSTWIRLGWALMILFAGTGVLAYIICAVVMPDPPAYVDTTYQQPPYQPGFDPNYQPPQQPQQPPMDGQPPQQPQA
ncbi:MAG: PspC domain-containing protein [Clostridia bacterium]|nr:PspC domain-containing protein [Clostridia bacterium]